MISKQLKKNIGYVLRICILEYPEHNSIDSLDKIISFILNIS